LDDAGRQRSALRSSSGGAQLQGRARAQGTARLGAHNFKGRGTRGPLGTHAKKIGGGALAVSAMDTGHGQGMGPDGLPRANGRSGWTGSGRLGRKRLGLQRAKARANWAGELRGRQQTSSVGPIVATGQKWGKER
jgi:hypothetical protein